MQSHSADTARVAEELPAEPAQARAAGQVTRLLVPISASHGSHYAVHEVVRRSIADAAMEVHLLNVRAPMNWYAARFISAKRRRDWHRAEGEQVLQPCRRVLDRAHVPYAVHVELGARAECIPRLATRLHCDRILIGTARAKSLTRLLEDAEIRRVVARSTVPVEVVAGDEVARWERYGIPAALGAALALWAAASE